MRSPCATSRTAKGKLLGVTYNYTGYPLVREARELVAQGAIGQVRLVQVEFLLGWLSVPLEAEGVKQTWRIDPAIAGPSGVVADIGTHALHLAKFVTGLTLDELAADIQTFVARPQARGQCLRRSAL